MVRLDDLLVFVRAADLGGFSAAARELRISAAVASAAIKRLEAELGEPLFLRSTRSLRLSEGGERFLDHARAALQALGDGQAALARGRSALQGTLRVALPSDLGRSCLLAWIDELQAEHPRLHLHVCVSDRLADLFRQPIDVAFRYGRLDDSGLVSLPIAPTNARALCAAPSYLARRGAPRSLDELADHNCLRFVVGDQVYSRWVFGAEDGPRAAIVAGDRVSDDAELVRRWALAGLGIAYKSRLDVADDLAEGRLVELLSEETGEALPLHMVCMERHQLTPVVRRLRERIAERCAARLARAASPRGR
ncbi:MAG: LysR family transcriptional regulator [Nannocystaceae bacterium]